jgi:glyoxylase-like metal-dependent hydrolase (beta-lactamase superfamily II)
MTLHCGDAYTTLGGVATTDKVRLPFPLASMATWDPATEIESARALRDLQPARLAPGHGKVVEAPVSAMDDAIAKASR